MSILVGTVQGVVQPPQLIRVRVGALWHQLQIILREKRTRNCQLSCTGLSVSGGSASSQARLYSSAVRWTHVRFATLVSGLWL